MEANKTKSKFIYPNHLYARCKDNKTLDISYAPQTLEAVEYTRTDALMKKARKWFERQNEWRDINGIKHCDMEDFDDFRKYMEGE